MGRSVTPTYRIESHENPRTHAFLSVQKYAWDSKTYGRANVMNLEKWRKKFNESFKANGVNAHASEALGYVPYCYRAVLVRQSTDEVVAEVNAPAFEVV